ncbi:MAG: C69 family dipeptidase, partial [Bacteroidota bacterium]|nr:C69 family dipeptidase [Bacteroidota bacterium]
DHFFVTANSYRIGNINFNDSLNFISSPGLQNYCKTKGLWNGRKTFNFSLIFGGGRIEKSGSNRYNTLRMWRAMNLLSPGQNISSELEYFPMFIKPDQRISLEILFSILRDYYNNTPYDIWAEENLNKPDRSIADWNCVHSSVISLNPGQEADYGSVIWTGLSTPYSAVYIPAYFGISTLPFEYKYAPEKADINSAFWTFKILGDSFRSNYPRDASEWIIIRNNFEKHLIVKHKKVVKEAAYLFQKDPEDCRNYLNQQIHSFVQQAFKIVRLESKDE